MAIKTFTTGEVLTASDTNTFLANAGLDYITQVTVPSSTASLTISNCFSATYDNYRLVFDIDSGPGNVIVSLQLRTATTTQTTNYKSFLWTPLDFFTTGNAVSVVSTGSMIPTYAHTSAITGSFDIISPFLTTPTNGYGNYCTVTNAGITGAIQTDSTSFVSVVIAPGGGTISGGKIFVYGYRQA
jgi:hypothetical protein